MTIQNIKMNLFLINIQPCLLKKIKILSPCKEVNIISDLFDHFQPMSSKQPGAGRALFLTISRLLEIDISISQGPACNDITANTNGHDLSSRRKLLVEHGLGDIWMKITYIQRGQRVCWTTAVHPSESLCKTEPLKDIFISKHDIQPLYPI